MSEEHKSDCMVCGKELVYLSETEKAECYYCKEIKESNARCAGGHFVCDACHARSANEIIKKFCVQEGSTDPLEMALVLMRHPALKMHGPEHHFLVPAVLLSAYYNIKKDPRQKAEKIEEARKRAENVLGGYCGFYGNCGAAVGTGMFISLITDTTPLSTDSWRLSNLVTAQTLEIIANLGGPRCCKRNSFLAIVKAVEFLKENFGVEMKIDPELKCEFNSRNRECRKARCPFFPRPGP